MNDQFQGIMMRRIIVMFLIMFAYSLPVYAEQVLAGLENQYTEVTSDWWNGMIENQSFETKMSEYDYPVWVVSYMPTGEDNDVKIKIIHQDNVLEELEGYTPDKIKGQTFTSLDAVSFVDYNLDGNTDILIVKTWEDITVSAVYDGSNNDSRHFYINRSLSDTLTENLSEHTISNMLDYCGYDSAKESSVFSDDIPKHFAFGSGAGAWGSGIDLYDDGSFDGHFSNTDMGANGEGYNSTAYHCECHGKFGNIEKHGDYYYSMTLEEYSTEQEVGTSWISEVKNDKGEIAGRMLNIIADPLGIYPGTTYYLFLPGAQLDELPVSLSLPMIGVAISDTAPKILQSYVLYNADQEAAFSGYND